MTCLLVCCLDVRRGWWTMGLSLRVTFALCQPLRELWTDTRSWKRSRFSSNFYSFYFFFSVNIGNVSKGMWSRYNDEVSSWHWCNKLIWLTFEYFAFFPLLRFRSWLHCQQKQCETRGLFMSLVIPLLHRRCTRRPQCFHFPKTTFLNYIADINL